MKRNATHRVGFTVIELMVVIVIIAILMAILLPALSSVRARAQVVQVATAIKALETGIAIFKTEFGSEPPSRITLCEDPADWSSVSATNRSKIRKLWPQFDFTIPRDINGNGTMSDVLQLNGAECLVFFLGGVNSTFDSTGNIIVDSAGETSGTLPRDPAGWIPQGFSKNPRDPFERSGGTRVGPMTEFDPSRFVDIFGDSTSPATPDGMPELLDPFPGQSRPYVYASGYEGKGYDAADLFGTGMISVYLQKLGASPPVGNIPWKKTGYQIISPGFDGEYGTGGLFAVGEDYILPTDRSNERDNVTNFSSGQLSKN